MQRTPAIQVKTIVLAPPMEATMQNIAGQLAPSSRQTYTVDAKHFAQWLAGRDLSLSELHRDDLVAYRTHLAETYAQSTDARWSWTERDIKILRQRAGTRSGERISIKMPAILSGFEQMYSRKEALFSRVQAPAKN